MNAQTFPLEKREISFSDSYLVHLILPLLFEQLLTITVGLADSMMVSTVGEASISAVSLVDSISNLMIYIFTALATGGAAVAGQYLGRADRENARKASQQLIVLVAVVALGITAFLYLFRSFILTHLFGQIEPDVMEATNTYYSIVMASIPAIALYNGGAALMRAMSRSGITLRVSVLMNVINLLGNYILIFRCGFDVSGVAIPTLVSRYVAAIVILSLLMDKKQVLYLSEVSAFRLDRHMMGNIASIGIPSGIENGMFHFGRLILFSLISTFGTASIVANAVGNTVGNFHAFSGKAVDMGLTTVISQCVGAGRPDKARFYMRKLVKATYVMMAVINILIILAIPLILRIYDLDPEAAELARTIMLVHGISAIVLWLPSFMLPCFLRAAGDAKFSMYVSVATMWLVRVLGAYIVGKYMGYGVIGVWVMHSLADWAVRSVIFIIRYRGTKWETKAIK